MPPTVVSQGGKFSILYIDYDSMRIKVKEHIKFKQLLDLA